MKNIKTKVAEPNTLQYVKERGYNSVKAYQVTPKKGRKKTEINNHKTQRDM